MKKKYQHSKLMFNLLLLNGILWVWACFILAYFDKPQIAEKLAIASVTTILGSFITLCTKSYKETKQEAIQKLNEKLVLSDTLEDDYFSDGDYSEGDFEFHEISKEETLEVTDDGGDLDV